MKKPDSNITETGTIRLANGHIPKLREIMRAKGREWFEKWVRKEHEKLSKNRG